MKIIAGGGYGAKTANLKKWGNEVEIEIQDPNQPNLPMQGEDGEPIFDNTEPIEENEPGDGEEIGD